MILSKNANNPEWKDIYTYVKLSGELQKLEEIAYNLWWTWTPKAKELFKSIDKDLWEKTEGNPIAIIRSLSNEKIATLLENKEIISQLNDVYKSFSEYMAEPQDMERPSVGYFSMEYGLSNVLKIYSGGLGVLAGDYLKEASDSNVRLTAVGFLYRQGYFTQSLSQNGQQIANYENQDFTQLPIRQILNEDGSPMIYKVAYNGFDVYCNVWVVNIGRIKLYLMDTDLSENSEYDRFITAQLYGGDWENRMKQEYLLGIGGVQLLEKLGISKDVYHMNEGHAAFMSVQRLLNYVEKHKMPFQKALEIVRASSLYTVHTPVPAGHDYFDEGLLGKYLSDVPARLGISWQEFVDMGRENPGSSEKFSMSVFALNTCQEANGVSYLHGIVSQNMFAPVWKGFLPEELHVSYVTNGVHLPTWTRPEWQEFYKKYIGSDYIKNQTSEDAWANIRKAPDTELWNIHMQMKQNLVDHIKSYYSSRWLKANDRPEEVISIIKSLDTKPLFIGFGRRFATYKRAHLLFTDLERLAKIVNNPDRPIRFIYTGKAHPADGAGQGLIKRILEISRMPEFMGKIIFLENYDMRLASKLIAGVDVWMNTPTRPLEASGTSGEKAEMNGVLNLSVLDGWWYEGYREGAGWALTDKRTFQDQSMQDKLDAATIYEIIEKEILPLYFENRDKKADYPKGWVEYMKNSLHHIAPNYTMRRMMDDYFDRFYNKLANRSKELSANNYAKVDEIIAWKEKVSTHWNELEIMSVEELGNNISNSNVRTLDCETDINLKLNKHSLDCELDVELVIASENEDGGLKIDKVLALNLESKNGSEELYTITKFRQPSGHHKIAIRIVPRNEALPHRQDFAYIRWVNI